MTNESVAGAFDPVAVVVRLEGGGVLLSQPSASAAGPAPRVKYESLYYTAKELKLGLLVQNGNVVRTGPATKAVIAFNNGDHFAVGPGTEYVIGWKADAKSAEQRKTQVDLHFGSIRGVVQPGGPNQGMKLRSRAATMGVRGTEFYIEDAGTGAVESKIAVLRGKVEVAIRNPAGPGPKGGASPEGKPQEIPAGSVAKVAAPGLTERPTGKVFAAFEPEEAVIQVALLNKKEVAEIRTVTAVPPAAPAAAVPVSSPAGAASESVTPPPAMPDLEKAMGQALLADIRTHEPELYREIERSGDPAAVVDLAKIQEVAFVKLEQKAPEAPPEPPKPPKPTLEQLKPRGDAVYEEYLPSSK